MDFLPQVETPPRDVIAANFELPTGTPGERTAEIGARLEAAAHRAGGTVVGGTTWRATFTPLEHQRDRGRARGTVRILFAATGRHRVRYAEHVGAVQFALPDMELKPQARTLGLTLDDLARQVRSAFFGSEALRVLRGREDMRVYVRLPEEERNSVADIERYVIRTAGGSEVPLGQVATARFTRSSTAIHTVDGQRVIAVTASVDSRVANAQQVNVALESEILEPLAAEHPGFSYAFGGEQRQQRQTVEALRGSLIIVFMIMFALLAIPFGSYSQPLIVMAAIPLGFVGAILGHLLLGLSFGFMSLQGLVGCFGVVVNDSLVMINFINEKRDSGLEIRDAIIVGTKGTCPRDTADIRDHVSGRGPPCLRNRPCGPTPRPGGGSPGLWRSCRHSPTYAGCSRAHDVTSQSRGASACPRCSQGARVAVGSASLTAAPESDRWPGNVLS